MDGIVKQQDLQCNSRICTVKTAGLPQPAPAPPKNMDNAPTYLATTTDDSNVDGCFAALVGCQARFTRCTHQMVGSMWLVAAGSKVQWGVVVGVLFGGTGAHLEECCQNILVTVPSSIVQTRASCMR